jgi:hypothetical protein
MSPALIRKSPAAPGQLMVASLDNLIDALRRQIELAAQVRNSMTFIVKLADVLVTLAKQFEIGEVRGNGVKAS